MNWQKPLLLGILTLSCTLTLATPLSNFDRFRSYPYMDKSYREAKQDNWTEVEKLTRHLLSLVPNNDEARTLLVDSLMHQQHFAEAHDVAQSLGDSKTLTEVRLAWIEHAPPPVSTINKWLASTQGAERARLWQAYSQWLGKNQGPEAALTWLKQVPDDENEYILRLTLANWAEQARDWDTVVELLSNQTELSDDAWQRLANAHIQRFDEVSVEALLATAPSEQVANNVRRAMADRAVGMNNPQQALYWLAALPASEANQPQVRTQALELARQTGDVAQVVRLSHELQRPCAETVDWLIMHDRQEALRELQVCSDDPAMRLRYAQLLQESGHPLLAANVWAREYQRSSDLNALDQATFLWATHGQPHQARTLLLQAFNTQRNKLPPLLLKRLATLQVPDQLDASAANNRQAQASAVDNLHLSQAYALEAAGDSSAALKHWSLVPLDEMTDNARLTAAHSALASGDGATAESYWQQASLHSADDWALGAAIAEANQQPALALQRQRQALTLQPSAEHYYTAALTAERAADHEQSTRWLADAVRLAPHQPRYRAEYGMSLASADTPLVRAQAIPYLERATQDYPEDYLLGETLAWRYNEVSDSAASRQEFKRVIDLEQTLEDAGDDRNLQVRLYRQRKAYQTLTQRDSFTLSSSWVPEGTSTNDNLRPDGRNDRQRRAMSQNVQVALWDHALGEEPNRNGRTLSVYSRILFGGSGRSSYAKSMGAGVGLRYKPFGAYNLNLYGELYHQRQINDYDYDHLTLGNLLNPGKVSSNYSDLRNHAQSSNDLLLRATASFLDQGRYRNDWRVDEDDWDERLLYLDAAWWTHAGDHQWLSRFQQGHAWKLPVNTSQTIMPYGVIQFSSQDPNNDWRQDLRVGAGLRWQMWFDGSRYFAYNAKLTVRTEYQRAVGGNLYEKANGMLLGLELNF